MRDSARLLAFSITGLAKGQIISKGFLVSSISSKKRTKEFDFTTMIHCKYIQGNFYSFLTHFLLEAVEDRDVTFNQIKGS